MIRGAGLGMALASVLILMFGQSWNASAIRDRWTTPIGFASAPIVGEVYAWLNARAAAIVLILGLALQVLGAALADSSSSASGWMWSLGVMLLVAVGVERAWVTLRESQVTRRLVLMARGAGMPDVSDIQFLWHLDQDRAKPLVDSPSGLEIDPLTGAPPSCLARDLLRATAYGRRSGFDEIEIIVRADDPPLLRRRWS